MTYDQWKATPPDPDPDVDAEREREAAEDNAAIDGPRAFVGSVDDLEKFLDEEDEPDECTCARGPFDRSEDVGFPCDFCGRMVRA
jgi:hypothetical protein